MYPHSENPGYVYALNGPGVIFVSFFFLDLGLFSLEVHDDGDDDAG